MGAYLPAKCFSLLSCFAGPQDIKRQTHFLTMCWTHPTCTFAVSKVTKPESTSDAGPSCAAQFYSMLAKLFLFKIYPNTSFPNLMTLSLLGEHPLVPSIQSFDKSNLSDCLLISHGQIIACLPAFLVSTQVQKKHTVSMQEVCWGSLLPHRTCKPSKVNVPSWLVFSILILLS